MSCAQPLTTFIGDIHNGYDTILAANNPPSSVMMCLFRLASAAAAGCWAGLVGGSWTMLRIRGFLPTLHACCGIQTDAR